MTIFLNEKRQNEWENELIAMDTLFLFAKISTVLVDSFPSIFIAWIFDYQESLFFELESPEFAQQPGVNY